MEYHHYLEQTQLLQSKGINEVIACFNSTNVPTSAWFKSNFHQLVLVSRFTLKTKSGKSFPNHLLYLVDVYDFDLNVQSSHLFCCYAGRHRKSKRGCWDPKFPRPDLDDTVVILVVPETEENGGTSSLLPDEFLNWQRILDLLLPVAITNSVHIEKIKILRFLN